jgi:Spy/CpxP family protein refolding chaperone
MTTTRTFMTAALIAVALAAASLAIVSDASARGGHGGMHGSRHGAHHSYRHHHGHLQLRHYRQQHHARQLFTRYQPCVVWTRQGWTDTCALPR